VAVNTEALFGGQGLYWAHLSVCIVCYQEFGFAFSGAYNSIGLIRTSKENQSTDADKHIHGPKSQF
jgi:hypothetical protein